MPLLKEHKEHTYKEQHFVGSSCTDPSYISRSHHKKICRNRSIQVNIKTSILHLS